MKIRPTTFVIETVRRVSDMKNRLEPIVECSWRHILIINDRDMPSDRRNVTACDENAMEHSRPSPFEQSNFLSRVTISSD